MAAPSSSSPSASEGSKQAGQPWRRGSDSQFEWIAPGPSPAVVAELEQLFPDIVQVPVQSLMEEEARWQSKAVLARSLSRWVHPDAVIREFHRSGIQGGIEAVSLANRHFLFRFSDCHARELALGRPWIVNGQPLAVAQWKPDFLPAKSSLTDALLWIRLPQLPIEYWTDEALSSILSAAGQFIFKDASTRERARGGFARACVRVDLSKPLRPGARIRGNRAPFWQPFSYENLEGLCSSCGTLHLVEHCGVAPGSSSATPSNPGLCYGPWMVALRRRKAPSDPLHSAPSKMLSSAGLAPPSSASPEGWSTPKKTARRNSGRGSLSPLLKTSAQGNDSASPPPQAETLACRFQSTVPAGTDVELGKSELLDSNPISPRTKDPNPFACLELDHNGSNVIGHLKASVMVPSSSAKRARPVEPISQRRVSKTTKAKGKGLPKGKGSVNANFTFSAPSASPNGFGAGSRPGPKKSRSKDGSDLGFSSGSSLTSPIDGMDHVSAVSLLKKAIQCEDSVMILDSPQIEDKRHEGSTDTGLVRPSCISAQPTLEKSGDMDDVPPSQSLE